MLVKRPHGRVCRTRLRPGAAGLLACALAPDAAFPVAQWPDDIGLRAYSCGHSYGPGVCLTIFPINALRQPSRGQLSRTNRADGFRSGSPGIRRVMARIEAPAGKVADGIGNGSGDKKTSLNAGLGNRGGRRGRGMTHCLQKGACARQPRVAPAGRHPVNCEYRTGTPAATIPASERTPDCPDPADAANPPERS
ncbi:hypothetical protein R69919_00289 [Paraburkholderia gardini]|uniref:Uncharacterized protein n=1 Tax=Paraburkholderia gardini TaxID=2823469 RepID=A0ABM8U0T9_9BURK|nr:hypothetical protein R69919_00289 [Paraburkholderia gardini]CAG4892779.1 hypothetical protein R54767_01403 [Paraburkholderia gardini]